MKAFAYALIIVGILNFLVYFFVAASIGGDAINGKIEGGKYYLEHHGRFTEVSRSVFEYSRFHTYSVWVTFPLVIFGAYLLAS